MRTLKTFIIVMACAVFIGIAFTAFARDDMSNGAGGWYQQNQGWDHRDSYGSAYHNQMGRSTDRQFNHMIDRRDLNSNAYNQSRNGQSMMGYAPRGGGYCR